MKLSVIIPVLNSHEIVRRQSLYFAKMKLPDSVEVIFVDDGSDPPIESDVARIVRTNDRRPWTQPKARNIGAMHAKGEFLIFTDIDHIVTQEAIAHGREYPYDFGRFYREFAILDEEGNLSQNPEDLAAYGLVRQRLRTSCHTLSMTIRKSVFLETGGYREKLLKHPTHDDGNMKTRLKRMQAAGAITKCPDDERTRICVFPSGRFCGEKDYNPFGLFHSLPR